MSGNGNGDGGGGAMILILLLGGAAVCCMSSSASIGLAWFSGWFDPAGGDDSTPTPTPAAGGKWVCPPGTVWGWGANAGKCCKDGKCGIAPKFVPPEGTTVAPAKWVCPAGYVWGWGANAGRCCKDGKCYSAVKQA